MSLLIWFPFINDTSNQGLLKLPPFSYNGFVKTDNGKLGSYHKNRGIVSFEDDFLDNTWSIACWVMSTSWSSTTQALIVKNNATSSDNQFYLGIVNGSSLKLYINDAGYTYNYSFSIGVWYHCVATYDGSNYAIYLNGEKVKFGTNTSDKRTGALKLCIGCRSNNAAGTVTTAVNSDMGFNDVRIYDHALSEKEVKELSKGLVLHYKLSGPGNENILTNSTGLQGTSYWNANVTVGNENGVPYLITKRTNTTTSSRLFYTHDSITTYVSSWSPGDSFTISGYYKIPSTESYEVIASLFIRWVRISGENSYDDTGFSTSLTDEKDKWIRFEKTYTVPSNYQNGSVTFQLTAFSKGLSTVYWRYVKLEKGDKATPWCPSKEDTAFSLLGYNDNIEYDLSGYKNNGTRTGTFTWTSDTPKYAVSTEFNTNNYIIINPLTIDMNNVSFATWVKWDAFNSYSRIWDFGQAASGGGYCCFLMNDATNGSIKLRLRNASGTELLNYNFITANTNTWYHIAFTLSNTTCKAYVNGVLKDTKTLSSNIGTAIFNYPYIGKSNWSTDALLDGKLSDFRIYATALSAEDVKELYSVSASIDNAGNLYSAEVVEG